MIAEKIAQVKKEKQKKLINLVAIIGGAVVIGTLLLYLLTNVKLTSDEQAIHDKPTQEKQRVLTTKSLENTVVNRQRYLDAYQHYQITLMPPLSRITLTRWDKPVFDRIQLLDNTALEQFSSGNYASALNAMTQLTALAKDTIERSQNEYNNAIISAKNAYSSLDYSLALLALQQASQHQKSSQELSTLSIQVESIPKIRNIVESIRISNIENKPEDELQAISALANLDPDWGDYRQRTATLVSQISTKKFNQAIARAYRALDKKLIKSAQAELNKASSIFSSRVEINQLSQAIAQLTGTIRLATSIENADNAAASDDWESVRRHIKQALIIKPNYRLLTDRLEESTKIIALKKQMATLLSSPYRLAIESVQVRAKVSLIQAESHAIDSPSLRAISTQLVTTLNAVNKEVAVALTSDGKTSVSLRGVGIVGSVTSKTIQLKPGPYTFEGKRQGYKSKIVKVTIPMNKTSFKLTVVADERI
jgi:hypothetical protein